MVVIRQRSSQSGQRIFGVGTVTVQSSDKSCPVLELRNIKHPRETKEIIHQAVEQMKLQRRMRVGEVMGDDYHHDDMEDDHMDDDWE